MDQPRNIDAVLDAIPDLWSPHILAEVNDYDVKVANIGGTFDKHVHTETDEFFLVLAGTLHIDLPDRTVTLGLHDVFTVPRGVPHRPRAEPGTRILMLEPRGTVNTGNPATGTSGTRLL